MPLRAIVFDLDGTLLDTLADIAATCNHALSSLGQPTHPPDDYRMMVGEGADVLVRRALPPDREDLADHALRLFKGYYDQHPHDTTVPYPGIPNLLDELTRRGFRLAVLTNKPQAVAETVVAALLGSWEWLAVCGHREGVPKKPDPTAATAIAKAAGVAPHEIGVLGDSHIDMRTALAAGMLPIGAAWGFRGREELLTHGARIVIDAPCELLAHL